MKSPRKPERILSGRRLRWAGVSALIACIAGCALPLLAGLGVAEGACACLGSGAALAVGVAAFSAAAFAIAVVWRRGRREAESAASPACCSPAANERIADGEPIVCTLASKDAKARVDEYRAVFGRIRHKERFDHGFAWRFSWNHELEERVHALVAKEEECCRFFRFKVRRDGGDLIWETRASDAAAAVLEAFFHLPEQLLDEEHPGSDREAIKATMTRAGLAFSSEGRT
jgi:hypothetical protein